MEKMATILALWKLSIVGERCRRDGSFKVFH